MSWFKEVLPEERPRSVQRLSIDLPSRKREEKAVVSWYHGITLCHLIARGCGNSQFKKVAMKGKFVSTGGRRRVLITMAVSLLVGVMLLSCVVARFALKKTSFSKQQFEMIVNGMTKDRVEKILEAPPGDYTTVEVLVSPKSMRYASYEQWICDDLEVCVEFDQNGRVRDKAKFGVVNGGPRGRFDRTIRSIRSTIGW